MKPYDAVPQSDLTPLLQIYLAMEAREPGAREKATEVEGAMGKFFRGVHATFHPVGIAGEIAGKSSNVAFAARSIFQLYHSHPERNNVIMTVIDCKFRVFDWRTGETDFVADTLLQEDYFNEIRRYHVTNPSECDQYFYVCPFIFDRNAHNTPVLVRCADLLSCWAGMSSLHPGNGISIPTSVYSLPLSLAERVGDWDADPTAIGEDMHMLLKTFFGSSAQIITQIVYSPASQCNVSTALTAGSSWTTYIDAMCARYDQALRHMWGALDTGYCIRNIVQRSPRLCIKFVALWSLMWQAHFLSGHLLLLIIFTTAYGSIVPADHIHPAMTYTFWICARLRDVSFVVMQAAFTFYYYYHTTCVQARREDQGHIDNIGDFSRRTWSWTFVLDRLAFPIAGVLFGSVPMIQAVVSHLFTNRLVYRVSKKPTFS